ncbi:YoaK family protein [Bradyrhizobium tropiciagri]|uniref:YoaK family protein n=1 Tax=Bradyrhizobium tropiciagri TaxID=312253 RepID=UPI00067ADF3E|nr:YoaK family protein [Bradyrhizobium tropiciagri]
MQDDSRGAIISASLIDDSSTTFLAFVLSMIAGNTDVISFLGLGGLFAAHITGNLVVLATKLVVRDHTPLAQLIAVPVFVVVLAMTRVLATALDRIRVRPLTPLLLLQFLLLFAFLAVCVSTTQSVDPNTVRAIFASMLGVSAMAVQNALVRISLNRAPSTAVMTTNVTLFTLDMVELLLRRRSSGASAARDRARHTWPAIAGFLLGCTLGAATESAFGLRSLLMPAGLALLALVLGVCFAQHNAGIHRSKTEPL